MASPDTLLDSLERFAAALTGGIGIGIGDVLHNLTEEMTDVLHLTGADVTLVQDGKQRFVTEAVEGLADIERIQENQQRGPCIDAATSRRSVTVPDLAVGDSRRRWPDYTVAATTAGLHAVAGIPMVVGGEAIGAMSLYDGHRREWSPEDLRVAAIFASIASGYIAVVSVARQHQRTAEQLQQALNTRLVIEQAKGVLAAKRDVTVDEAFRLLRKHARDRNTRIHEVARAVVEDGLVL